MNTRISNDKSFFTWVKQTCSEHPEILDHMRKSTDPLNRAIAVRIMINAGVVSFKNRNRVLQYPESRKGK